MDEFDRKYDDAIEALAMLNYIEYLDKMHGDQIPWSVIGLRPPKEMLPIWRGNRSSTMTVATPTEKSLLAEIERLKGLLSNAQADADAQEELKRHWRDQCEQMRTALQRIKDNGEQGGYAYGVAFAALNEPVE